MLEYGGGTSTSGSDFSSCWAFAAEALFMHGSGDTSCCSESQIFSFFGQVRDTIHAKIPNATTTPKATSVVALSLRPVPLVVSPLTSPALPRINDCCPVLRRQNPPPVSYGNQVHPVQPEVLSQAGMHCV